VSCCCEKLVAKAKDSLGTQERECLLLEATPKQQLVNVTVCLIVNCKV
jgi:hypothetical protein